MGPHGAQHAGVGCRAVRAHALIEFFKQKFARHLAIELAVKPVDKAADFGAFVAASRK